MDLHTRSFSQLLYHHLCQHVINLSCSNFYFKQSFVVKFGGMFPSGFIFGKFLVILLKIWHINVQLTIFEYFTDKDPSSNQIPFYCKNLPAPHPTSCIHYVNKKSLYLDTWTIKALHLAETGHMSQQLQRSPPFQTPYHKSKHSQNGIQQDSNSKVRHSWCFLFETRKISTCLASMLFLRQLLGNVTPVIKQPVHKMVQILS